MPFFYYEQLDAYEILTKSYNPYLVVLSITIAIISAFTAFAIAERISAAKTPIDQGLWILFGATTMGMGVWSMHFIGLLALVLPIPVSYDLHITLLSMLPAIFATSLVLWLKQQQPWTFAKLLLCGVLLGTGIGTMHYVGMMAIKLNAGMFHTRAMFVISILVAICLATFALKIQTSVKRPLIYCGIDKKLTYSAILMGLAISGMHYSALAATVFVQIPLSQTVMTDIDPDLLASIIGMLTSLSLLLAIITPMMLKYREMSNELLKHEESLRIAATAFQTHEAIMITDAKANIVRVNDAFTQITGFSEHDVLGKNPRLLSSGKHGTHFYQTIWQSIVDTGNWSGEIWNRRKNGDLFPEWQTISAVRDNQGIITHYVSFFSDITDFKNSKKQVEELAYYDSLTNLPNRRLLYTHLAQELNNAKNNQRIGALLFMDLDRFKNINDSLGHSVGDALLIEVAERLKSSVNEHTTAIRLGGDEFIVLLAAQNDTLPHLEEHICQLADNIINQINQPYLIAEHELYISTSIGITLYTDDDDSVDLILKRADTAMYYAKDAGRNTYRFYQQRMQEIADARLNLEKNLRKALERNEFSIEYQPQSSFTGKIIGAEALIRWQQAEQGDISPNVFIPIAEETGLIIDIGNWVIKTVCQQINQWDKENITVAHVSINISPKQFHRADFVSSILQMVKQYDIKPDRLLLEITEGVFLENIEDALIKMNALREQGFSFSIDDFGTGYSSLSYLSRLPFDQLKIDQSFVNNLMNNHHNIAIVQAIIVMADGLKLNLIAEGVETNKQLNFLSEYGCHYFQGYYFSRPLTVEKFKQYYLQKMFKQ